MRESGEMYLETIHVLSMSKAHVRAIDVVVCMNYSKPSVSRAMAKLKSDGDILIDGNGYITLTPKGLSIAEKIYERHQVISTVLESLGVSPETAAEDACKIEHDISDETFETIKAHLKSACANK